VRQSRAPAWPCSDHGIGIGKCSRFLSATSSLMPCFAGNDVRRFEVTWVDHPGRRMSEEYVQAEAREAAGLPPILEHYDWQEESDLGLRLIVERIDQKAQKRYRPKPNLLLHVNLDRSEHAASSLYAWQIGQMFGDSFDSIWLLWGSRAVRLWPNPARIKAIASPA
jgi:hypothetical protein